MRKRKSFCIALVFLCVAACASARDDGDFHLSFESFLEYRQGYIGEHLYAKNSAGDFKDISYLEWEEKPLWVFGENVFLGYRQFDVRLHLASAIASQCGSMYDSDWKLLNDVKTNYSISENTLESYLEGDVTLGYTFRPFRKFHIKPTVQAGYYNIKFNAQNTYGWHAHTFAYTDPAATYYAPGQLNGIDYNQTAVYTFAGISFIFLPVERLRLGIDLALSPWTYIASYDFHYLDPSSTNARKYFDEGNVFFNRFKGDASISFDCNDICTLGLSVGGLIGFPTTGNTFLYSDRSSSYERVENEKAGTSISNFSATFGVTLHVF